jgi:hypothetical protein
MVTRARFERATPSFGGCSGNPATYRCCFAIRKTWFGPVVPGGARKCHRVTRPCRRCSRRTAPARIPWGGRWDRRRIPRATRHAASGSKLRKLTTNLDQLMQAGQDPAIFEKEIEPKLKTVSLLETMQATGLSRTYCGMIRRGVRIPHPRHWGALRELVRSPGR